METIHPQVEVLLPGFARPVEVDEEIAPYLTTLNRYGFKTRFSCQGTPGGDFIDQQGYVSFVPGTVITDKDCRKIEEVFGIEYPLPVYWPGEDRVELHPYWSTPWDARREGGRLHGWAIYFGHL